MAFSDRNITSKHVFLFGKIFPTIAKIKPKILRLTRMFWSKISAKHDTLSATKHPSKNADFLIPFAKRNRLLFQVETEEEQRKLLCSFSLWIPNRVLFWYRKLYKDTQFSRKLLKAKQTAFSASQKPIGHGSGTACATLNLGYWDSATLFLSLQSTKLFPPLSTRSATPTALDGQVHVPLPQIGIRNVRAGHMAPRARWKGDFSAEWQRSCHIARRRAHDGGDAPPVFSRWQAPAVVQQMPRALIFQTLRNAYPSYHGAHSVSTSACACPPSPSSLLAIQHRPLDEPWNWKLAEEVLKEGRAKRSDIGFLRVAARSAVDTHLESLDLGHVLITEVELIGILPALPLLQRLTISDLSLSVSATTTSAPSGATSSKARRARVFTTNDQEPDRHLELSWEKCRVGLLYDSILHPVCVAIEANDTQTGNVVCGFRTLKAHPPMRCSTTTYSSLKIARGNYHITRTNQKLGEGDLFNSRYRDYMQMVDAFWSLASRLSGTIINPVGPFRGIAGQAHAAQSYLRPWNAMAGIVAGMSDFHRKWSTGVRPGSIEKGRHVRPNGLRGWAPGRLWSDKSEALVELRIVLVLRRPRHIHLERILQGEAALNEALASKLAQSHTGGTSKEVFGNQAERRSGGSSKRCGEQLVMIRNTAQSDGCTAVGDGYYESRPGKGIQDTVWSRQKVDSFVAENVRAGRFGKAVVGCGCARVRTRAGFLSTERPRVGKVNARQQPESGDSVIAGTTKGQIAIQSQSAVHLGVHDENAAERPSEIARVVIRVVVARFGSEIGSNRNRTELNAVFRFKVRQIAEPNAGFRFGVRVPENFSERVRTRPDAERARVFWSRIWSFGREYDGGKVRIQGLDERDECWTALEHDMMCIEHAVHIASKHVVEKVAPTPQKLLQKKIRSLLNQARSNGELNEEEVASLLSTLGGGGDTPESDVEGEGLEWTTGDAVGKVLALIKQIRMSPQARTFFAKCCVQATTPELELLLWVRTRCAFLYKCLDRVLTLRKPIDLFVRLADDSEEVPDLRNKYYRDYTLSKSKWEKIQLIHEVLREPADVTQSFSSERTLTVWRIIPTLEFLIKRWETMSTHPKFAEVKDALLEGVKSLRKWFHRADTTSSAYFICLVLNPTIKDVYFRTRWGDSEYKKGMKALEDVGVETRENAGFHGNLNSSLALDAGNLKRRAISRSRSLICPHQYGQAGILSPVNASASCRPRYESMVYIFMALSAENFARPFRGIFQLKVWGLIFYIKEGGWMTLGFPFEDLQIGDETRWTSPPWEFIRDPGIARLLGNLLLPSGPFLTSSASCVPNLRQRNVHKPQPSHRRLRRCAASSRQILIPRHRQVFPPHPHVCIGSLSFFK
ncbi:hypothetical protein DFH09DRAFT_1283526 [Mycena vulgaris]|nr:hypothetical protein DFH09DRAFT_1283526 [Mycena vulgaris]